MNPPDNKPQTPDASPAEQPTLAPSDSGSAPTNAFPAGSATSWQPAALPARLGRYEVRKLLGKGGMGSVYLAHDPHLDRPVALKIPALSSGDPDEQAARFFREARSAGTLHHPGICPVFEVGQIDGVLYLTMAYIEGEPLSALVKPDRPLPPEQAVRIVRDLALALQEAHDHGVIHRDLKPANVMLGKKGQPVIMDFGLARRSVSAEETPVRSGVVMGTPAYMAPEQVNSEAARMGPATDVYAVGVILYELLCGRPPFEGGLGTLMARILLDPPPPLATHTAGLDYRLEDVITRALAKDPADRFASAADMAQELTTILETPTPPLEELTLAEPEVLDALPVEPSPRPRRKAQREERPEKPAAKSHTGKAWMLGCGGCLLAVLVAVGGLVYAIDRGVRGVWGIVDKELQRSRDFESAARIWKAPPGDADPDRLFPPRVQQYARVGHDDKAVLPDFEINEKAPHATYRGPGRQVELYLFRKNEQERYGMVSKVYDRVKIDKMDAPNGLRTVRGSASAGPLIYSGAPGPTSPRLNGVFWWKDGWLIHVSSTDASASADFLRDYLLETVSSPAPPAKDQVLPGGKEPVK